MSINSTGTEVGEREFVEHIADDPSRDTKSRSLHQSAWNSLQTPSPESLWLGQFQIALCEFIQLKGGDLAQRRNRKSHNSLLFFS